MKETNKIEKVHARAAQKEASVVETRGHESKKRFGNLLVVTGPSGVGKGTMMSALLRDVPGVSKSVSVTTRQIREGEVEEQDYFFRNNREFAAMLDEDVFLEWAEFAGHFYGTPATWVNSRRSEGVDVVLEIEVQGAKQVRSKVSDAILIFISPPSLDVLETRLKCRATESDERIAERLRKAKDEISERLLFDYEVINDNLDEAVRNLTNIVYAERLRIRNRKD